MIKRILLVLTLVLPVLVTGQTKPALKEVNITNATLAKVGAKAYQLDLTRRGTIFSLDRNLDYHRIALHTAKGTVTLADWLSKTGHEFTGPLQIGLTDDLRGHNLNRHRPGNGTNYSCAGIGCVCYGDDDCNNLFTSGVCDGSISVCAERNGTVVCVCIPRPL